MNQLPAQPDRIYRTLATKVSQLKKVFFFSEIVKKPFAAEEEEEVNFLFVQS